jgi:ABC-type branched-subunit amino acid transport system permease subunit
VRTAGWSPELGVLGGTLFAAAIGGVVGLIAIRRQGIYFAMLTRTAIALIRSGTPAAAALGIGVLILPSVGAWAMAATLLCCLSLRRELRKSRPLGAGDY